MVGGGQPDGRPPTTSPPPSSPLHQPTGGLGRRLLGSIRAILPARLPAPPAAAAPKVGLGLLLHLKPDHPCLRPTYSASASPPQSLSHSHSDQDAAAAAGPVTRDTMSRPPPRLPKPAAEADESEEHTLLVEESGASGTQAKDVPPAAGAGDDSLLHEVLQPRRTGEHLRPAATATATAGDDGQEHTGDAPTFCDIAAAAAAEDNDDDDKEKNAVDAVEDGEELAEQCVTADRKGGVISTAVVDDQDKVVQQCAAAYGAGAAANQDAQDKVLVSATTNGCHTRTGKKEKLKVVSATANGSHTGAGKKEKVKVPYPQRPGKLNCPSYISKGTCSYGFSCQFHHPPLNSWYPSEQRNHGVAAILELNRIGLPIREGARNCTFYMRNGACRYGKNCHFNHPEHVIDAQFCAPTGWVDSALQSEKSSDYHTAVDDTSHLKKASDYHTTVDDISHWKKSSDHATLDGTSYSKKSSYHATLDDTSYSKKSSDHATLDDTSYSKKSSDHATLDDTTSSTGVLPPNIFRMLLPPQKVLSSIEAKVIAVKKDSNWSCTSDDSDGCCSADSSDGPLCKQEHLDYPERPGRPECPFYMRFGDCKFASACKYQHPEDKYPERPGEQECPFYMKTRFCKFGAQCRFNHPKDPNRTAQSPRNAKHSVTTNEQHRPTRVTLEDHMPKELLYPERPGQPDCRYYLRFGKCKFMSACIFHHPRDGLPAGWNPSSLADSDQIGPGIHGMPDCPFYMKRGKCQFGSACEFRHPEDTCSTTEGAFGHRTSSSSENSTRPESAPKQREETMYPERPGEPECFQYMDHGYCRFQMKCKYHHPAVRLSRKQHDSDLPLTSSPSTARARQ